MSRLTYALVALLLTLGALVGFRVSSADFTDGSVSRAQVGAARDWTPPVVSVDDPGFVVTGNVTVTATASDADTSVASVRIEVAPVGSSSWTVLCTDTSSPWACPWSTTTMADGDYQVRAVATDVDGNSATSAEVSTTVSNATAIVLDPVATPTRGSITMTARITNPGPFSTYITFQGSPAGLDTWTDVPGCAGPGATRTCVFDTTLAADGTYDWRAVGTVAGWWTYYDHQRDIVVDNTAPTVTVEQAAGQADPTNASPVRFRVAFSEPVTGFDASDVTLGGTGPGATVATVSGSGATYTVEVTGMAGDGTVTASVPPGAATDEAGNPSDASTSTDNSVQFEGAVTSVTVNQAATQPDPTNGATINFTVIFSKSVTGFSAADVVVDGTVGGTRTVTVTGSGRTYNVAVSSLSGSGTLTASVVAGAALDAYGNPTEASTSTDNEVTRDVVAPTVTLDQATGQADPTNGSTISFTVVFSEPVTGFATGDVTISGTTTGTKTATVTGSGTTYDVAVTGMTSSGTVIATIASGRATDAAGNTSSASTSTDNTVTRDVTAPTVTINQAASQPGSTSTLPINFTVVFSEPVTGFDGGDVTLGGTTGGTKVATVTGSGTTYNVAVSGVVGDGTVTATVPSGGAVDAADNGNAASTSTDNTVTYNDTIRPTVTINQAAGQADPTNGSTINFTVVFSEPVTGFATGDVTISGTTTGTKTATVTGSGTTYNVAVTGMTSSGTVIATIASGRATDAGANTNLASTSTDNTVTRDVTAPTVTINQAAGQPGTTGTAPINFTVVFSEPVTGFATGDVTITGTAGGTKTATVTGSGTTYNVAVTGMTTGGTVVASIPAARAADLVGNANTASTSTDNSVLWQP